MKLHTLKLLKILNDKKINRNSLQQLSFNGISDEIKGLRPIVWRILLNHFSEDTSTWDKSIKSSKEMYDGWKDELIVKPTLK